MYIIFFFINYEIGKNYLIIELGHSPNSIKKVKEQQLVVRESDTHTYVGIHIQHATRQCYSTVLVSRRHVHLFSFSREKFQFHNFTSNSPV